MRHISFDESSVLREFAKIANEKQLIKVAQPSGSLGVPQARTMPQTTSSTSQPGVEVQTSRTAGQFEDLLRAFPTLSSLYTGAAVKDAGPLLNELTSPKFADLVKSTLGGQNVELKTKMQGLLSKATPLVQSASGLLNRFPKEDPRRELYEPKLNQAVALLRTKASEENSNIKQAIDKLYDVSEETGENLVEQAHPGGGTSTELTHSKTKENLIETIVEQQERDVEVAHKAPKGTYAALVNLYNKLSKMGFEDKLDVLKTSIAEIATVEDVVEHTLVTLADDLDKLGHVKYADQVDALVKKKV